MEVHNEKTENNVSVESTSSMTRLVIAIVVFVLIVSIFRAAFNNVVPALTKQRLSKITWIQALSLIFVASMLCGCNRD